MNRPVRPESWKRAMHALRTYDELGYAPEPVVRISLTLACRAFYGSYLRAAWGLVCCAIEDRRIAVIVSVRSWWYRLLGLSEHEIERRWRA